MSSDIELNLTELMFYGTSYAADCVPGAGSPGVCTCAVFSHSAGVDAFCSVGGITKRMT